MTWFDKYKRSRRPADLEREVPAAPAEKLTAREALAISVEGLAEQEKSGEDEWSEEEEEDEDDAAPASSAVLIPPRLRLQSRPMPIVRIDVTKRVPARNEGAREATSSVSAPSKRLGRSTKVRLQAVHSGQAREPVTELVPIVEMSTFEQSELERNRTPEHDGQALVRRIESPMAASPASSPPSLLCGSGVIEAGQKDAPIHNPHISEQSVVMVMLSSDPGPVVVHYVSLQPRSGFTLHMSAPATATASFNYAVWLF